MSIDFYPVRYDHDSDLFRIPEAARADLDNNSINVSQANGLDLLDALGISASCGVKPLAEFTRLLAAARQADLAARKGNISPALPTYIDAAPGRMTMIHCGRRSGYIEGRLSEMSALVERGRALGATHLSWG
jgi:hypothetical protein